MVGRIKERKGKERKGKERKGKERKKKRGKEEGREKFIDSLSTG